MIEHRPLLIQEVRYIMVLEDRFDFVPVVRPVPDKDGDILIPVIPSAGKLPDFPCNPLDLRPSIGRFHEFNAIASCLRRDDRSCLIVLFQMGKRSALIADRRLHHFFFNRNSSCGAAFPDDPISFTRHPEEA